MNKKPSPPQQDQTPTSSAGSQQDERPSPEEEPAADRGERIATGKAIARGGHNSGFAPGAQPHPSQKTKRKPI